MFEKVIGTGVNDVYVGGLYVFPNPSNGVFNIESDTFQFNIDIVDCLGKRVFSKSVDSAKHISFKPHLSKGIYFLKLSDNTKTQNVKIIIN